jgi:phenylalanine-4-hydroxylase
MDQKVWTTLFNRQIENLQNKSCESYLVCLNEMKSVLNANQIPVFDDINKWFKNSTGWTLEVVPGLIPVDEFFKLLSEKKFCSSTWLRTWEELDYLEEPDMFHDTFGHIPLLANPTFSKFALAFGKLGLENINDEEFLIQLQRLYWFTIEFGLMKTKNGTRIYGAGIISSFGESISSISAESTILPFNLEQIINTPFKNDEPQTTYFEIENFDVLYDAILTLKNNQHELGKTK